MIKSYLKSSDISLLCILISILLILTWLQQEYVAIPQLTNMPVVDDAVKGRLIENFYKYRWVGFLTAPLILLLRITLTTLCLFIGGFFDEAMPKQNFRQWWNVVLKADIVMILSSMVSCLLSVKYGAEHAMEISRYFSFAFLGNPKSTEQWVQIPLSALNVFEVCYWFFMSKLLSVQTGRGYWASFRFIMGSYGTGYLFYIVFVMFLVLYLI